MEPKKSTKNRRKSLTEAEPTPHKQIENGKSFYANLGLDVRHFSAIWHVYKIGQLMEADLNRIGAQHGLSLSDFHLLGALMMSSPTPVIASDLALSLNLSTAVLSIRITKLQQAGLISKTSNPDDRRQKHLALTEVARDKVIQMGSDLERLGRFAHHYKQLKEEDQEALDRITNQLHAMMHRDFMPTLRGDS